MLQGPFDYSIVKNAIKNKFIEINFIDIRDFGIGNHKTVDDTPYGGGHGMILKVDVLKSAIDHALDPNLKREEQKIILTSAGGKIYDQKKANEFSKIKHLIIICGHYEGVDSRINKYIDEEISVGNFVLTGGEIPAMIIIDSVTRLIPGVLKEGVVENESHSIKEVLEHPQYTRPQVFDGQEVPDVLISGDHKKIEDWKKENSKKSS